MKEFVKQCFAEFIGVTIFLTAMTGSGILGDRLSSGNDGVTLIGQSISTSIALYLLINIFGPLSKAHFNPLVSILFWEDLDFKVLKVIIYIIIQITGACLGVLVAHLMYDLDIFEYSNKRRTGYGQWVSEVLATMILLATIYIYRKKDPQKIPQMVSLLVMTGIWFTSSTFFCNPAVTIARAITNTFIGIDPRDIGPFIAAEILALILVYPFCGKRSQLKKDSLMASDSENQINEVSQKVKLYT